MISLGSLERLSIFTGPKYIVYDLPKIVYVRFVFNKCFHVLAFMIYQREVEYICIYLAVHTDIWSAHA